MTFLLQKFNAINRTRTEVRARNGLRSPAGSIAFTGRLAVACLLLAGFLGVGSAMAQVPTVLRVGGGSVTVPLRNAADNADNTHVHHYIINPGANQVVVNDPLSGADNGTFVAGTIATVSLSSGSVTVTPIAPGVLKIAGDTGVTTAVTGTTDAAAPVQFEIMSTGSPAVVDPDDGDGTDEAYNLEVQGLNVSANVYPVALTVRDKTSGSIKDVHKLFEDSNDISLTYSAKADAIDADRNGDGDTADDGEKGIAIVTATISGTTLTIALTDKAVAGDMTKVWLTATDSRGEYARLRINVPAVTAAQNYFVASANKEGDKVYRDNDTATTADLSSIDLTAGFTAGARGATVHYSVAAKAENAAYVTDADDASYTIVAPALVASVTQTGDDPAALGSTATFQITDIRSAGEVMVTVSATDVYKCPAGFATGTAGTAPTSIAANACTKIESTDDAGFHTLVSSPTADQQKDSEPNYAMGGSYSFKITVITKTTPKPTANAIGKVSLVADGDSKMVDLADLDAEKDEAQAAFEDATEGGLTYTVALKDSIAVASVEGSVITFAPLWHGEEKPKATTATVTAENNLGETFDRTIAVEVTHAISPIVNEKVQVALATGFTLVLNTGDEAMTVNLANVMISNPADPTMPLELGPVFMNPYPDHGTLPGGLLYTMGVEADFKSPESTANNVITSAMIVTLDPQAAMLKVTPTGANSAVVTLTATNRADKSAMVSIPVMVVSGVSAEDAELPTEVSLSQNYPNPFNPQTTIDYALPQAGDVSLVVYDMLGREVDVLLDGPQAAGRHTVRFGANHLPNGTYVYRLVAGNKTITRLSLIHI